MPMRRLRAGGVSASGYHCRYGLAPPSVCDWSLWTWTLILLAEELFAELWLLKVLTVVRLPPLSMVVWWVVPSAGMGMSRPFMFRLVLVEPLVVVEENVLWVVVDGLVRRDFGATVLSGCGVSTSSCVLFGLWERTLAAR